MATACQELPLSSSAAAFLQSVPYVCTSKPWTFRDGNVPLHVQSCKLARVSVPPLFCTAVPFLVLYYKIKNVSFFVCLIFMCYLCEKYSMYTIMLVGYLDNFVGLTKALSERNSLICRGLAVFLLSSSHLTFTVLKEIPDPCPLTLHRPSLCRFTNGYLQKRRRGWELQVKEGLASRATGRQRGGPWVSEPHPSAENPLSSLPAGFSLRTRPRTAPAGGCHAPFLLTRLKPEQLLVNNSLVKPQYMCLCYKMGDNMIVNVTLTIIWIIKDNWFLWENKMVLRE